MAITAKSPECGTCHRLSFPATCSIATAMLLVYSHAGAAEWKITPTLDLKETYTDNVRLAAPGLEKSDFITQVNPGISLTGTGPRLKLNANYVMQNLVYAEESSPNTMNHMLNANANAELVDNLFFLDGRAAISQQNISLLGPQSTDNVNITGNRTEVQTYSVSPYLRHRLSNYASTEIRYTHNEVSTGGSGMSNSQADRIQLSLNSGSAFKTLGWGLNYHNEKTSYGNTASTNIIPALDSEVLSGNLSYSVTPKFRLTATGGYEKNNYISTGPKPDGSFWSAGFSWAPSAMTSIDASAGRRFFGDTYSLAASHRTRLTNWSVSYSEDITSTRNQFLIPATISTASLLDPLFAATNPAWAAADPVLRQQLIDNELRRLGLPTTQAESINYLTNRLFLQKRLQASVAVMGAKNTLVLSLFHVTRDAQTSQTLDSPLLGNSTLALNDNTKQVGGNAFWSLRIGPRTSANLNIGYIRNSFPSLDRTDNDKTIRLSLTRQFQPKLNGSLEFRRLQRDSSQSGSDYSENALIAFISMRF